MIRFKAKPILDILSTLIRFVPNIIVLGGVANGSIKANEAAMVEGNINNNGVPVPYIIQDLSLKSKKMNQLPIVSVTHGPTLLPSLTSKSLALFLEKYGYTFTEIFGSDTPLRI